MKHICQSAVFLLLSCAPVMAQDSWAGNHLGAALVQGDGAVIAQGNLADQLDRLDIDDTLFAPKGQGVALRVGRDWQRGRVVIGVAAEYLGGRSSAQAEDPLIGSVLLDPRVTLSGSRRILGRVGYAAGDWLPYAMAGQEMVRFVMTGLAQAHGDIQGSSLGLGIEHRATTHLSTFAEYSQTDFDPIPGARDHLDITRKDLRLGANFRF